MVPYIAMKLSELGGERLLILGLGREGLESYRFIRHEFPEMDLGLADRLPLDSLSAEMRDSIDRDKRIKLHLGDEYLSQLASYDIVIRSPGVPMRAPELRAARNAGVRITSQTEIFLANCRARIVGVTGTKGKSTTASLIHAILKTTGFDTYLAGNIGIPPLRMLRRLGTDDVVVLELSSYQLDGVCYSPHIAVLLNITPEHLDLHGCFAAYVDAKRNITRFQTANDVLIYNPTHPTSAEIAASTAAQRVPFSLELDSDSVCYPENDCLMYRTDNAARSIVRISEINLPGRFNLENVMAAICASKVLGADSEAIATAVRNFEALPYRLERIGTWRGITFYDDPLATTPEATVAALEALGDRVATVMLGGYDRGIEMNGLARRLRGTGVSTVILFPPSGARIWSAIAREYHGIALPQRFSVAEMREAVALAFENTPPGRICLHSPASPSFGLFRDYADRGDQFRRYVRDLGSIT